MIFFNNDIAICLMSSIMSPILCKWEDSYVLPVCLAVFSVLFLILPLLRPSTDNRGDEDDNSCVAVTISNTFKNSPFADLAAAPFLYAFITPHHYSSSPDENLFIRWQNNLKIFPRKMFTIYSEWSHIEPNGIMVVWNVNDVVLW